MSHKSDNTEERMLSIPEQLKDRQALYNAMLRDLITFGTTHPYIYKKPTLWQRFKWRVLEYRDRLRDAWLVLIGRAHIADD